MSDTATHDTEDTVYLTDAQAAAITASPLDQALRKSIGSVPTAIAPSLFDHQAPLTLVPQLMRVEQVTGIDGYEELEGYGCTLAVNAMQAMTDTVQKIIDGRDTLRTNQVDHEAKILLDVNDLHDRLTAPVLRQAQVAVDTLRGTIATVEAKLTAQVQDSAHGPEVRAYFRGLEPGKKMSRLMSAINAGDAVTVGALLNSTTPAYLSGLELNADARAAALRQWHSKRDPKASRQLALMTTALGRLEAAGSAFVGARDGLIGARDATVRKARAAREKYRTVTGVSL